MKGLLCKEWCIFKHGGISSIIIILALGIIYALYVPDFIILFMSLLISMIPVNYMAIDESSNWQQYSLALPYKRSTIVSSKYIFVLILITVSTVLSVPATFLINDIKPSLLGCYISASFACGMVFPSFMLPLNYKFGTAKSRVAFIITVGVICGAAGAISGYLVEAGRDPAKAFEFIGSLSAAQWTYILFAAGCVIFALSWLISVHILKHKDF